MNVITMHGKLTNSTKLVLVNIDTEQVPMAIFVLEDSGLPYAQHKPLLMEVHYLNKNASSIRTELIKDKMVVVSGTLTYKDNKAGKGLYIMADKISFDDTD